MKEKEEEVCEYCYQGYIKKDENEEEYCEKCQRYKKERDKIEDERILAIEIIEQAIEPWRKKGIKGERYYELEDAITNVIKTNNINKFIDKIK